MKKRIFFFCGVLLFAVATYAQDSLQNKMWTEKDRQYLIENMVRTRQLLTDETAHLTPAQWTFKESPERWSIAQIIEHLFYWEIIYSREIDLSLRQPPQPELNKTARPDSAILNFLNDEAPHVARDYTWPLGKNDGKNNLELFLKLRDSSIAYIKTAKEDLRAYYINPKRPNVHQLFINVFGHCDRHLRQIRKVKLDPRYPKGGKK